MARIILGIGGNTGNREKNLIWAADLLSKKLGQIIAFSPIIESEAWGYESENWYLNQVLVIDSNSNPSETLKICMEVEKLMGRERSSSYVDRTMDIDILFYDDLIISDNRISIPHPRLHNRSFVLKPLEKLLPDLVHPILGLSIKELLVLCGDKTKTSWYRSDHSTVLLP